MIKLRLILLSFIIIFITDNNVSAQNLPDSVVKKINALFVTWDKKQSPGCAVAVIRNDSLIFSKGYGMANLEYGIPNSAETIFPIASVSKQFTAYEILLLEQHGELRLDDDIRKYLPWFPQMGQTITIRHLLNHTSGIRDQWQLLSIAGTRLDDVITQEQVIKVLSKQQALNFKPGERFNYSNSNYTLLAQIVQKVTGNSFRKSSDSLIFSPLGMIKTHFHDDYTEVVSDRAYSYNRKDSTGFSNSILSYGTVGATGLFTNVTDLSKWVMNFYNYRIGDHKTISNLTQKGKLNDGKTLDYAAGIYSTTWKGWRQVWHDGSDAGYRACITVFPDLKMGFIVLSNLSEINALEKANQIADLLIKDTTMATKPTENKIKKRYKVPVEQLTALKKQLGDYISEEGNKLIIELKNDSLYYHAGANAYLLIPESEGIYSLSVAPEVKFKFSSIPGNKAISILTPDNEYIFNKYMAISKMDDKDLNKYTGIYHSSELDCNYGIVLKHNQLFLTNNKYDDTKLTLAGTEHLLDDNWWINSLKVVRNQSGQITGFELNSVQVAHLKFMKLPCLQNN
jgi:CubicO group peptidase (beta-lactamase class C family)